MKNSNRQLRNMSHFKLALPRKHSVQPPCSKQCPLEQIAQDCIHLGLNISEEGDSTTSLAKTVPVSD